MWTQPKRKHTSLDSIEEISDPVEYYEALEEFIGPPTKGKVISIHSWDKDENLEEQFPSSIEYLREVKRSSDRDPADPSQNHLQDLHFEIPKKSVAVTNHAVELVSLSDDDDDGGPVHIAAVQPNNNAVELSDSQDEGDDGITEWKGSGKFIWTGEPINSTELTDDQLRARIIAHHHATKQKFMICTIIEEEVTDSEESGLERGTGDETPSSMMMLVPEESAEIDTAATQVIPSSMEIEEPNSGNAGYDADVSEFEMLKGQADEVLERPTSMVIALPYNLAEAIGTISSEFEEHHSETNQSEIGGSSELKALKEESLASSSSMAIAIQNGSPEASAISLAMNELVAPQDGSEVEAAGCGVDEMLESAFSIGTVPQVAITDSAMVAISLPMDVTCNDHDEDDERAELIPEVDERQGSSSLETDEADESGSGSEISQAMDQDDEDITDAGESDSDVDGSGSDLDELPSKSSTSKGKERPAGESPLGLSVIKEEVSSDEEESESSISLSQSKKNQLQERSEVSTSREIEKYGKPMPAKAKEAEPAVRIKIKEEVSDEDDEDFSSQPSKMLALLAPGPIPQHEHERSVLPYRNEKLKKEELDKLFESIPVNEFYKNLIYRAFFKLDDLLSVKEIGCLVIGPAHAQEVVINGVIRSGIFSSSQFETMLPEEFNRFIGREAELRAKARQDNMMYFIYIMDCDEEFDRRSFNKHVGVLRSVHFVSNVNVLLWRKSNNSRKNFPSLDFFDNLMNETEMKFTMFYHDQPDFHALTLSYLENRMKAVARISLGRLRDLIERDSNGRDGDERRAKKGRV